jgi:hypothetical protein
VDVEHASSVQRDLCTHCSEWCCGGACWWEHTKRHAEEAAARGLRKWFAAQDQVAVWYELQQGPVMARAQKDLDEADPLPDEDSEELWMKGGSAGQGRMTAEEEEAVYKFYYERESRAHVNIGENLSDEEAEKKRLKLQRIVHEKWRG